MLATVGWYQSAVSGLSTGSPAGASEPVGVSEAGLTGRLMARRASCRGAAAGLSRRKPSDSSSAGAVASGAALSGAVASGATLSGVAASGAGVVAPVVAAGDSGGAVAGGAVTASPAWGGAEGAPAAGAAAVPGAVVAAGVPGAGVPGAVVAAAWVLGAVLAAGSPGVVLAAGVPASVLAVGFARAREVVVFARGLAVVPSDRAGGVFDRDPAVVAGREVAAVVFGLVPGPGAVDWVPGSSEAAPEASGPSAVAGHASASVASALAWSRPVEAVSAACGRPAVRAWRSVSAGCLLARLGAGPVPPPGELSPGVPFSEVTAP